MKKVLFIFIILCIALSKVSFAETIYYKDIEIPTNNSAVFVPPNKHIKIILLKDKNKKIVTKWFSPKEEGEYPINIKASNKTYTITAIVGASSRKIKDGHLNGFYLGNYSKPKGKYKHLYKIPSFFYKITTTNSKLYLSKNFKVGKLAIDEKSGFPQYVAFDYHLLKKLELIKNELIKRNKPNNFVFAGGAFISPSNNITRYEEGKGMVASMSRHMYGDAVDFIIDDNLDGIMDDLNEDGKIDFLDAKYIEKIITYLEKKKKCKVGGVGLYAPPKNDRVLIHVDTRGYRARWEH